MGKEIDFKLNDLVEVTMWEDPNKKNWVIVGFAGGGSEVELLQFLSATKTIVEISKLKHQKKIEVDKWKVWVCYEDHDVVKVVSSEEKAEKFKEKHKYNVALEYELE